MNWLTGNRVLTVHQLGRGSLGTSARCQVEDAYIAGNIRWRLISSLNTMKNSVVRRLQK